MKLVKYRSNNMLPGLRDMGSLFDHLFNNDLSGLDSREDFCPALDVVSEKDAYVLSAELPGVKSEDVELQFEKGILTLSGEKKSDHKAEDKDYCRIESSHGKFVRKIRLPEDADSENITAHFENGILKIRVKKAESAKPKSISIETN